MIDWREAGRTAWYVALLLLLAVVLIGLWATASWGRWKPQYAAADPIISKWYGEQRNSYGMSCCDKADGHDYFDTYTVNPDGSVTLANGHKIPPTKVLTGPNPTGHAVWWYLGDIDYCFAPGPMG